MLASTLYLHLMDVYDTPEGFIWGFFCCVYVILFDFRIIFPIHPLHKSTQNNMCFMNFVVVFVKVFFLLLLLLNFFVVVSQWYMYYVDCNGFVVILTMSTVQRRGMLKWAGTQAQYFPLYVHCTHHHHHPSSFKSIIIWSFSCCTN